MDIIQLRLGTLVISVFVGVCLFIAARYIRIPAIVLLLIGGVVLGPEGLSLIDPKSLGQSLRLIISLCVAIILFEGGLSLKPEGFKKAPKVIWKLLTIGVGITWFGTSALIHFLLGFPIPIALLSGSLVIVTGPTVIAPLLNRISVKDKLYHILHWEGVLIDPIGVFIAILCFEWLSIEGSFITHIGHLSYRLIVGIVIGVIGGLTLTFLLRGKVIPEQQVNTLVFATALFLFGISESVVHEAGILTVVIAGLVIGWTSPPQLKHIKKFKSELTEISIALVFILLAANLELHQFSRFGWKVVLVICGVLFIIRPLSIMLCTKGSQLRFNEKLFLSWIAPRGVVAGSMASLFGLRLSMQGNPDAIFLETFTFSIIATTIIFQGLTAGKVARWLKVEEPEKKGWLIIGAHLFSRKIASFIMKTTNGVCVLIDTNEDAVKEAQNEGFIVIQGNALSTDILPLEQMSSMGNLLALTDNRDLNQLICEKWSEIIDRNHLFRWSPRSAQDEKEIGGMGKPLWSMMPKPSQLAYELKNMNIDCRQLDDNESFTKSSKNERLISFSEGALYFSDEIPEEVKPSHVFVSERLSLNLIGLIKRNQIFFLDYENYDELLNALLSEVEQIYPDIVNDTLKTNLLEREVKFPSILANSIAVPHTRCSSLTESICVVVQLKREIQLQPPKGGAIRVLFLLFTPEEKPEQHLMLLAEIAKIASSPLFVESLINVNSIDDLILNFQGINAKIE